MGVTAKCTKSIKLSNGSSDYYRLDGRVIRWRFCLFVAIVGLR